MFKRIFSIFFIFIILIQFLRINKSNPDYIKENDFLVQNNAPSKISKIVQKACYDCHSNETKYPWYSNISPISWSIASNINKGREYVNFSEWNKYNIYQKNHIIKNCISSIKENSMPLKSYILFHKDAKLNEPDKKELIKWFTTL